MMPARSIRQSSETRPPAPHRPEPAVRAAAQLAPALGASVLGTVMLLVSLLVACLFLGARLGADVAHAAAVIVGIGILLSALADLQRGPQNLVRADLFMLLSFYFLTFCEFLFPQPGFNTVVSGHSAAKAVIICLWGFAGLAIGRHLFQGRSQPFRRVMTSPISGGRMTAIFLACALIGYLHMLVAVHFNLVEMVTDFVGPRFSQPWQRGKFGNWAAIFDETGMLLYLLPPMAGIILARRNRYSLFQVVIVAAILVFTLFFGFTTGTRNLFDSFLVTFLIGYALALPKARRAELITITAVCFALLLFSTSLMLKFRAEGLNAYLNGVRQGDVENTGDGMHVDMNLYPIASIADIFPDVRPYLGFEMVYVGLIRPIPRALWKNKPEGLSTSIEDTVGRSDCTVAASFAGEAYMCGGYVAVFCIAAIFGWCGAWWNRLVSDENSQLGILIYASGFFACVISMRSMLLFTTAMLPTMVALIGTSILIGKGLDATTRLLSTRPPAPAPIGPKRRILQAPN